jgi:hypothetical protein
MAPERTFLPHRSGARPWKLPEGGRAAFETEALFLGKSDNALQVAVAQAGSKPNTQDIRSLWERRQDKAANPLLLVIIFPTPQGTRAIACGPAGDKPPVTPPLDPGQLERIAETALEEPSRHAAIRLLNAALPDAQSDLPGIRNAGMFASHELRTGVPMRKDWREATELSMPLLAQRGKTLVEGLGYTVETRGSAVSLLRADETATAIAVFLEDSETPEGPSARFNGLSPVSHALAEADKDRLPWVVVTRGPEIRVYASSPDVGVGRKGRSETFIGANLSLLPDDRAGYLGLIFGAKALADDGTFEEILEQSKNFSVDLARRLRDRVYVDVIPQLAEAIALRYDFDDTATDAELGFIYEASLVLLFRMLFIAYAEDRGVLPNDKNSMYQHRSLKTLARELAERRNAGDEGFDESATDLWQQVQSLFRAVNEGNKDWGVPPYDGGLFSSDQAVKESGYELATIDPLTNAEVGPAITALLVDEGDEGVFGPVDFRSLSVREFGTLYEGLLESNLSMADTDLTIDKTGTYVPAKENQEVWVEAGTIYLHNRSGARKSSGSYFTKPFAVEHLLDDALEPAIDEHLARIRALLDAGSEADAAEAFFDFRCADIAMGSGHFLVAAVDRIEARLSSFLAEHAMPRVIKELDDLRDAAFEVLGELGEGVDIEHAALLRRLVGRRCIYGVDINEVSVDLARLAIWIHTFVPGLPLSFLDHNLVQGNSLTGIGTIEEAVTILEPKYGEGQMSLHYDTILEWLDRAKTHLKRLATVSEASIAEVKESRSEHEKAMKAVEPVRDLFDLLVAARVGEAVLLAELTDAKVAKHKDLQRANELRDELNELHFPVAFPEVFLRDRAGFDCIIGNPPWETVKAEEHKYWTLRFPGLMGLDTGSMNKEVARLRRGYQSIALEFDEYAARVDFERSALLAGPFPGLGSGDPDLSEVFAWRFWQVLGADGAAGVVLPRSVLMSAGTNEWRLEVLSAGRMEAVTTLTNSAGWVFDDAEPRYTIALIGIRRKPPSEDSGIRLWGPYKSPAEYAVGTRGEGAHLAVGDILRWTPGAAIPLLPSEASVETYRKMRTHPSWVAEDQPWRVRTYNELHSTADKIVNGGVIDVDADKPAGWWPVFKGESIALWTPETGAVYGWADPKKAIARLQEKRARQIKNKRSAFFGMAPAWARDPKTLPCQSPRVAWRKVARATDTRSFYSALLPPHTLSADHNYLLFFPDPELQSRNEAYLLGVFCSVPFDWHARLWVEANFTAEVVHPFPVPALDPNDPTRKAIEECAGRLAALDDRYDGWARAVGVPVGSVQKEEEKEDLVAQLDALVAGAFCLDQSDIRLIFETFHPTWNYVERLQAVLKHFQAWKAKT